MAAGETLLRSRGCPKLNLQIRADNEGAVAFYDRLGYRVDEVASMGKRLSEDAPVSPS
jgi:ribosomal protein S18 acetylase RimI-like enzyme